MATATITFDETGDGQVDVAITFSDPGMSDDSPAHVMALEMVLTYKRAREEEQTNG